MDRKLWGTACVVVCSLGLVSCLNVEPTDSQQLDVDAGEDFTVEQGETTLLRARVSGGSGVAYRWTQVGGTTITIAHPDRAETDVGPFNSLGEHKFRVLASTASGEFGQDYLTINSIFVDQENDNENTNDNQNTNDNENSNDNENDNEEPTGAVLPDRVRANVADEVGSGSDVPLTASGPPEGFEATYSWAVVSGDATIEDGTVQDTRVEVGDEGGVVIQVAMSVEIEGSNETFVDTINFDVVPDGQFRARVTGPSDGISHEALDFTANYAGVPSGGGVQQVWEVVEGEGEFEDPQQRFAVFTPTAPGDVVVQLTTTLVNTGEQAVDEHTIVVYPNLTINLDVPPENLLLVGEPTTLTATATNFDDEDVEFSWRIVSGSEVQLVGADSPTPEVTVGSLGSAVLELTAEAVIDGLPRAGSTEVGVTTVNDLNPEVVIDVQDFGQIPIRLDGEAAPITVANFLHYVDDRTYDGQLFHRVIPDFVVQSGAFRLDGEGNPEVVDPRGRIPNESDNGLSNVRGTISMALRSGEPGSGQMSYFINLVDNSDSLDEAQHTVFGEVINNGMSVADAISEVETATGDDAPIDPVVINSIRRTDEGSQNQPGSSEDPN